MEIDLICFAWLWVFCVPLLLGCVFCCVLFLGLFFVGCWVVGVGLPSLVCMECMESFLVVVVAHVGFI